MKKALCGFILSIILFSGCSPLFNSKISVDDAIPAADAEPSVSFNWSDAIGSKVAGEEVRYYFYFKEVLTDAPPSYLAVQSGKNKIKLPKDGLYACAFVKDDTNGLTVVDFISTTDRKIAFVSTTGPIRAFDLGEISLEAGKIKFKKDQIDTFTWKDKRLLYLVEHGYENSLLFRFLNPDIDGDSVWDHEEGLRWDLQPLNYYKIQKDAIDIDSGMLNLPSLDRSDFKYIFVLLSDPDALKIYDTRFYPSADLSKIKFTHWFGDGIDDVTTYHAFRVVDGDIQFVPDTLSKVASTGRIEMLIPGTGYDRIKLSNLNFIEKNQFDGLFCFPVFRLYCDALNRPTKITWKWLKIDRSGNFVVPSEDEVRLSVKRMRFDIYTTRFIDKMLYPDQYGMPYWQNGTIELDPEVMGSVSPSAQKFFCDINDLGDTWHKIQISGNFIYYDPEFVQDGDIAKATLCHEWHNDAVVESAPFWFDLKTDGTFLAKLSTPDGVMETSGTYVIEEAAIPGVTDSIGKLIFSIPDMDLVSRSFYRMPDLNEFMLLPGLEFEYPPRWDDNDSSLITYYR